MSFTIEDIATEAGVSSATVSRVLNEPERVSVKTRNRVNEIIKREGYKPNIFARGLMKSSTNSVGILVSYITNPYMTSIINAIESTLARSGVYSYLCNCNSDKKLEKKYAEELLRRNVDALIVVETPSLNGNDNFFLKLEAHCPLILVNEHVSCSGLHFGVRCDQETGITEALNVFKTRHLFPIAFLSSNNDTYSFILKENLVRKFKDFNKLTDNDVLIYHLGETNEEGIVAIATEHAIDMLSAPQRPKAILAGNDLIALGVLEGARQLGLSVPEDLSIIGVDNSFFSKISFPPLTTVDLRSEDVGRMAAELYLGMQAGRIDIACPFCETIPSILCRRSTT